MARETKTHSNQDIILDELRIIQSEMKANSILLAKLSTTSESIETQTIKTNGRVTVLETTQNEQRGSIKALAWAMGVIVGAIPIIIAIHKYFLTIKG